MKRIVVVLLVLLVVVVAAGALSAGRACAHDPRFACSPRGASDPIAISDPDKSWAFYGRLAANQEDRYAITTRNAVRVPVSILVDERDAANPGRPEVSVLDARGKVTSTIGMARTNSFYEPFSRVRYLSSPERMVAFEPGTTAVVVRMRGADAPQRYVLAVGSEERFSVLEIPYLLGAIYRIHERRF